MEIARTYSYNGTDYKFTDIHFDEKVGYDVGKCIAPILSFRYEEYAVLCDDGFQFFGKNFCETKKIKKEKLSCHYSFF